MRKASEIREEIEARFGFFPPFFTPAEDSPLVLESLWQQTIGAYLESPLPLVFREKLFAYLARYCVVPYCLVCHSCMLRGLGLKAQEVLCLLEAPPPTQEAVDQVLLRLSVMGEAGDGWPAPGSRVEEDVFRCAIFLFLDKAYGLEVQASRCRARLRELLGPGPYGHLTAFLAYVKVCQVWAEAHPELNPESDWRTQQHLGTLLREEPRLGEFFSHYGERVRSERQRQEQLLLEAAEAGKRAEALAESLRQQTQALRESEDRLRLALESTALGTWDYSPHTGELCWDARCKALFGLREEEGVDYAAFIESVHPEERARVHAEAQRALQPEGGGNFREEFRIIRRGEGVERWVASRGRCFFDAQGHAVRFIGTVMDVTERRRTEENLRFLVQASEVLATSLDYEDTLERMAYLAVPLLADWCAVDILDERGQLRRLTVIHREPQKVRLAQELAQRYPKPPNATMGAPRVVRTGKSSLVPHLSDEQLASYARDEEHLRLLRTLGLRSVLIVPLRSRQRVLGALTLVQAESGRHYGPEELRLAEELARRAAVAVDNALLYGEAQRAIGLRDGFLQVAAHELRTPVTSLKLNTQALLGHSRAEAAWSERTVARLSGMERSVSRLGVLVNELLDISHLTSGRLVLHLEELDLAALVREVVERIRPEAERAGCSLCIEVSGPVVSRWDRLRLEQVLVNLLSNAFKYGAELPVEVTLLASETQAFLRVRDEGIGIDSAAQARIFERFERAVSDRNYGGLGMGLWISREIINAMGGSIRVESVLGQGATFLVELPRG